MPPSRTGRGRHTRRGPQVTIADDIGHRHLLGTDALPSTPTLQNQFVRIVVSDDWAITVAGQLLTTCLVNLLCRQTTLVRHLEVIAPDTRSLIRFPSGSAEKHLQLGLEAIPVWATGSAITLSTAKTPLAADVTILVGDPPPTFSSKEGHVYLAVGNGWRAWLGDPNRAPPKTHPTSTNPLGPFMAAALAAGEVFKRGYGIKRGRFLDADGYSLWTDEHMTDFDALVDGPEFQGACLAPVHLIGTGAVGNAVGYIAAHSNLAEAYFVLIDDDVYDKTNLNRCLLAGWRDRGCPKVAIVNDLVHAAGIGCFPYDGTIQSYLVSARRGLRSDVARRVEELAFDVVLSCVDKGASRQAVQALRPKLLMGGSTLDLQAKTHWYGRRPGSACLGCFNPTERHGEELRRLEVRLRNMQPEARARFLSEKGLNGQAIEAHLSSPECGGLGEAALKDFVTRPTPTFSAGFVSLGSGVLLAAALLRTLLFRETNPSQSDMSTLNFQNGRLYNASQAQDEACEQKDRHVQTER